MTIDKLIYNGTEMELGGGSGLDRIAIDLLETILKAGLYSSNQSSNITELIEHLKSLIPQPEEIINVDGSIMTILKLKTAPTQNGSILAIR